MRNFGIIAFALAPLLSGCAGSVLGDAMAGPQAVANRADAYCQSIGANPGTDNYTNCRMQVDAQTQQNHRAAWAGAAYMAGQSARSVRNCNATVTGNQIQSMCY